MKNKRVINNKGFTLIELLATVAILGIVLSIATVGVTSAISTSKEKSEKIFVEKLSNSIDDYLDLKGSSLTKKSGSQTYEITKCRKNNCSPEDETNSYKVKVQELNSINVADLVTENLINDDEFVNPKNKKKCLENGKNPTIRVFKDEDYVYYYYVDLSDYVDLGVKNTSCEISPKNGVINTLPDSLKAEVGLS